MAALGVSSGLAQGRLNPPEPHAVYAEPLALPSGSADADPLLQKFEQLALMHHPGLFEALARIDAAVGRSWQAGLPPNPTVGYTAAEIGLGNTAGQQGAFVGQLFVRGGKLQLDRAVACREVARLREEYEAMRRRVLTDVRSTYYSIYWVEQRRDLLHQFLDTNGQAVELARQAFAAGETARSDVLLAEIEWEQTRTDLVTLETDRQAQWRSLARLVGQATLDPVPLTSAQPDVPNLEWEDAVARMEQTPELSAAAAELSRTRWALRRALAQPIPNVNAQVSVQYDYGVEDAFTGVQVGLPLPKRNRNQGGIYAARAEIREAEQRLQRIRLRLERDLALRFGAYRSAQQQVERMRANIVPKAKQVVKIAFEAYQAGEISMSDVLNAQRSLLKATLRQQSAEQQVQSVYIEIEGFLLGGSLSIES